MGLYKSFKSGSLERDDFLKQKTSVLEKEEECLTELEEAQKKLADMERQLQNAQVGAENFQEYALLKSCDYEIVNRLISRVECFNDGHIKIHWNFKSEFRNAEPVDEFLEDKRKESDERKGAAVYTSNLFLMPQEEEWITSRRAAENYCHTELGIDDVRFFHDDNTEEMLYFREGYMKFIDAGRRKTVDALVINSFRDLYLSHQDLNDLLFWVIPKLECRFIALADQFDSHEASGQDYKDIYDKYSNVRKGDIMRYRTVERKAGVRKAKEPNRNGSSKGKGGERIRGRNRNPIIRASLRAIRGRAGKKKSCCDKKGKESETKECTRQKFCGGGNPCNNGGNTGRGS